MSLQQLWGDRQVEVHLLVSQMSAMMKIWISKTYDQSQIRSTQARDASSHLWIVIGFF